MQFDEQRLGFIDPTPSWLGELVCGRVSASSDNVDEGENLAAVTCHRSVVRRLGRLARTRHGGVQTGTQKEYRVNLTEFKHSGPPSNAVGSFDERVWSMTRIVSVHSFRGGTGKSNTSANLAAMLARHGAKVALIDTDVQSPGVHVLFGFDEQVPGHTLNDYLFGACGIEDAALDVSDRAGIDSGTLHLIPASIKAADIAKVLRQGYDVELLNEGFRALMSKLALDFLIIDTHPGLNEETLLSITISDVLLLVLRPDKQDYQGTAVTVDIARRLEVPELLLLVNKVPQSVDPESIAAEVTAAYGAPVAGVLPLSEDIVSNASSGLFGMTHRDHPWSTTLGGIAHRLLGTS